LFLLIDGHAAPNDHSGVNRAVGRAHDFWMLVSGSVWVAIRVNWV